MEQNIQERVNDRIQNGYKYDFNTFFQNGWELWKKTTMMMCGALLILCIPLVIIYAVAMPFLFGISSLEQFMDIAKDDPKYFEELQRTPIFLLKQMGISLLVMLIVAPLHGGCMRLVRAADKGEDTKFGMIFSCYTGKYFGKLLVVTLAVGFVTSGLNIAFGFIPVIGPLINLFCMLAIYSYAAFVQPLIVFADGGVGESFGASFKLAGKKFGGILGLVTLYGLLFIVGACLCGVGMLVTFAFLPICNYLL